MLKLSLFLLVALACSGCINPFRPAPTIMYRDGWGGTCVAASPNSYCDPVPYGSSMPPLDRAAPLELTTGWYLNSGRQWCPQRWARLGVDDCRNPSYIAIYP